MPRVSLQSNRHIRWRWLQSHIMKRWAVRRNPRRRGCGNCCGNWNYPIKSSSISREQGWTLYQPASRCTVDELHKTHAIQSIKVLKRPQLMPCGRALMLVVCGHSVQENSRNCRPLRLISFTILSDFPGFNEGDDWTLGNNVLGYLVCSK